MAHYCSHSIMVVHDLGKIEEMSSILSGSFLGGFKEKMEMTCYLNPQDICNTAETTNW